MAVKASFDIPPTKQKAIVQEIFQISSKQPELTPRNIETLIELANGGGLALVFVSDELAGWAAVEPLTDNLCEVGMVYVKPEFRSAEVFTALMNLVASRKERMLLASYDPALIRYVQTVWNAKKTNLLGAVIASRGRFITKRLNSSSRKAIQRKMQTGKPLFAIVGER